MYVCIYIYISIYLSIYLSIYGAASNDPHTHGIETLGGLSCGVVVSFDLFNPPRTPVVWWWVWGYLSPFSPGPSR